MPNFYISPAGTTTRTPITAFDSQPPPDQPPIDPASIDAVVNAMAAEQLKEIVMLLQEQIDQLKQNDVDIGQQLGRVTAAIKGLDCPDEKSDPYVKDDNIASVGRCIELGICTCNTGFALSTQPPLAEPPPDETSDNYTA